MISVLTLVKNRETHLQRLAEGLARSAMPPAELVIVDMSDIPVAAPEAGCPVRLVRLETAGLPLAQARNLAASHATAERLLFLDVDCIPSRALVGAMDAALARENRLICAEVLYLGPDDLAEPWTEDGLVARGQRHPVRDFPAEGLRPEENAGLFWSLAFGIRRASFTRLGGFDETFSGYGAEDTDLGFAAREAGIGLSFLGGCPVFHQYHGVIDPPLNHFGDIVENAKRFHRKWRRWPMEGWLAAFRTLGLVHWSDEELDIIRRPTATEIARAQQPSSVTF